MSAATPMLARMAIDMAMTDPATLTAISTEAARRADKGLAKAVIEAEQHSAAQWRKGR